ncbi:RICIN domain-containing protein [Catenuloplanes atrovinosus]|uniref:Ricin B lectin domain-containing protein n=1 Tax=Catenuloplanes atrovinosus TaxID=137266 RepID=A0AAE3YKJ3_9ACTN|nr:RICIN domain-containing protein [Catenuloplanes atrovinosus]MDR7273873.1 hypothetical protein [Catenuloplanes atrovinosus]
MTRTAKSTFILAASVSLAGLSLALSAPAYADDNAYFEIRNVYNDKCLDADKSMLVKAGTRLQLWDCHDGDNQLWYADGDAIRNKASGRCLDADTQTAAMNGTRVRLWNCSGSTQQQWRMERMENGNTMIRNVATGRGLDADRNVLFQNGTEVQLWEDWNGADNLNQQWYTTP